MLVALATGQRVQTLFNIKVNNLKIDHEGVLTNYNHRDPENFMS